jgi:hypothetical protein
MNSNPLSSASIRFTTSPLRGRPWRKRNTLEVLAPIDANAAEQQQHQHNDDQNGKHGWLYPERVTLNLQVTAPSFPG